MNAGRKINTLIIVLTCLAFIMDSCSRSLYVTKKELRNHIEYLSSDALAGRLTGTTGDSLTAQYIRKNLVKDGFVPITGNGLQAYKVTKAIKPGKNNFLSINSKTYTEGKDFVPLPFSSNDSLSAEVVFAGYGFNVKNDSISWNDYSGSDVKGKWVLLLMSEPDGDKPGSALLPYAADRDKTMTAKDLGAAGILFVSGKTADPEDRFEATGKEGYSAGLPAFRIKRNLADAILSASGKSIDELEKQLNSSRQPVTFSTGSIVKGNAELEKETADSRNVVMLLPGADPALKNQYLIIGAHFDHLGMGGPGSGSRAVDTVGIHHGADDNASGVAMMLELAERFSREKGSHRRSIVCVGFSGEEEGLLGSKEFVDNPGIDLSKVNAMINLDMVGRLNSDRTLQISGVGTAAGLKQLVQSKTDTSVIRLALSDEGYGPSDHSSFYGKNIPVLFYFTGAHADYHTPMDVADSINYDGMLRISDMVYSVAGSLANADSSLSFREAGPKLPAGGGRMKGITLGIMPDFAGVIKNGLRADFVTPGRPAALGGMKKGDIITAIDGKTVNNIQDYMFRMSQVKKGQQISVDVLRNGKKIGLLIQL
ncbi:MAG TPA: M20/M25/M40 family metallo-hydrolase [Bacteroidales bacterium]|nr:M20/M25/M40 family metallo-hydrolase [Bacteroidales bacterium]